jgi:hypothetical protein
MDGTRIHFPLGKVVCIAIFANTPRTGQSVPTEPLLFIKPGSCVVPLEGSSTFRPSVTRRTSGNRGMIGKPCR